MIDVFPIFVNSQEIKSINEFLECLYYSSIDEPRLAIDQSHYSRTIFREPQKYYLEHDSTTAYWLTSDENYMININMSNTEFDMYLFPGIDTCYLEASKDVDFRIINETIIKYGYEFIKHDVIKQIEQLLKPVQLQRLGVLIYLVSSQLDRLRALFKLGCWCNNVDKINPTQFLYSDNLFVFFCYINKRQFQEWFPWWYIENALGTSKLVKYTSYYHYPFNTSIYRHMEDRLIFIDDNINITNAAKFYGYSGTVVNLSNVRREIVQNSVQFNNAVESLTDISADDLLYCRSMYPKYRQLFVAPYKRINKRDLTLYTPDIDDYPRNNQIMTISSASQPNAQLFDNIEIIKIVLGKLRKRTTQSYIIPRIPGMKSINFQVLHSLFPLYNNIKNPYDPKNNNCSLSHYDVTGKFALNISIHANNYICSSELYNTIFEIPNTHALTIHPLKIQVNHSTATYFDDGSLYLVASIRIDQSQLANYIEHNSTRARRQFLKLYNEINPEWETIGTSYKAISVVDKNEEKSLISPYRDFIKSTVPEIEEYEPIQYIYSYLDINKIRDKCTENFVLCATNKLKKSKSRIFIPLGTNSISIINPSQTEISLTINSPQSTIASNNIADLVDDNTRIDITNVYTASLTDNELARYLYTRYMLLPSSNKPDEVEFNQEHITQDSIINYFKDLYSSSIPQEYGVSATQILPFNNNITLPTTEIYIPKTVIDDISSSYYMGWWLFIDADDPIDVYVTIDKDDYNQFLSTYQSSLLQHDFAIPVFYDTTSISYVYPTLQATSELPINHDSSFYSVDSTTPLTIHFNDEGYKYLQLFGFNRMNCDVSITHPSEDDINNTLADSTVDWFTIHDIRIEPYDQYYGIIEN